MSSVKNEALPMTACLLRVILDQPDSSKARSYNDEFSCYCI